MYRAVGKGGTFCAACYTNEYPVAVPGEEQAKIATHRRTG
jgi:hypothetical protein